MGTIPRLPWCYKAWSCSECDSISPQDPPAALVLLSFHFTSELVGKLQSGQHPANPSSLLSSIHLGNCLEQGTPGDAFAVVTGAGIRLADEEVSSLLNWCQISLGNSILEHRVEQKCCLRRASLPRLFLLLLLQFVSLEGKQTSYLK